MELEDLKSTWKNLRTPNKSEEEIRVMLKENQHPVLRAIRKQIIIELIAWIAFLGVYYSMFDGEKKPFLINLALILSLLLPIIIRIYGYWLNSNLDNHANFKTSVENFISRVKTYAFLSVVSNLIFSLGLILFFNYSINFTPSKYFSLGIIALVFIFQIIILVKIWKRRISELNNIIRELEK